MINNVVPETKVYFNHSEPHLSYDIIHGRSMGDVMYSAMQFYNNYLREGKTDRVTILKLDWIIFYILNIHINKYNKHKHSINLIMWSIIERMFIQGYLFKSTLILQTSTFLQKNINIFFSYFNSILYIKLGFKYSICLIKHVLVI